MDTNEKFSDLLQIFYDNIPLSYKEKEDSVLSFLIRVIQYIEKDSYLSSLLTFENADILLLQFLFIKVKDMDKIKSILRDAMYLMKSDLLFQNLEKNRKKNCFN